MKKRFLDRSYNFGFSNPKNLRGLDDRVFPSDRFPPGTLVVVAARMPIGIPMLRAEQIAASTTETGQPDLPPTAGAAVHLPNGSRGIRSLDLEDAGRFVGGKGADRGGFGLFMGGAGRGWRHVGLEAFLAHV